MDLGGQGGLSFQFDRFGAKVEGKIIGMEEVQQTDLDTGEPAVWQDGRPKMMIKVTLATDLRSWAGLATPGMGEDNGERVVYLRGSKKPESKSSLSAVIVAATKATGAASIDIGGWLSITYTGDGEKTRVAFNAPKQYTASYRPPSVDLAGDQPVQGYPAAPQEETVGTLIGWLNGKPITPAMKASMEAAGVKIDDLPGFVAA